MQPPCFREQRRARADDSAEKLIAEADAELHDYIKHPQWAGVVSLLGAAKAVLIAPGIKSGAVIIGYEKGDAVLLVRHGPDWSDPVFVQLSKTGIGFQAGVESSDLLMLVLTREAVQDLVDGVSRVGAGGGFALGSLGVGGSGSGGISGGMQTLSVSVSKGLDLGTGLASVEVAPQQDRNTAAYGAGFDMSAILAKAGGHYAPAKDLRETLAAAVRTSWND